LLVSVIYFVTDCFQLEDVRWSLNLQTASDAQAKQVIPKAVFQFGLKTDENTCDNVTIGFTHKELYEFYKQLETIQSQLDELHWTFSFKKKNQEISLLEVCAMFQRRNVQILLLHQALHLHFLKGLAFWTISFHITHSSMNFVQLFIFIFLKSSFISFSHIIFGLPASLVDIGCRSYNFLTILSFVIWCTWPNQLNLWA